MCIVDMFYVNSMHFFITGNKEKQKKANKRKMNLTSTAASELPQLVIGSWGFSHHLR